MLIPERKSIKVLDICCEGLHIVSIMDTQTTKNPYKVYLVWRDQTGQHRKKVGEWANFVSVIEQLRAFCHKQHWGFKESYFDWGKQDAV